MPDKPLGPTFANEIKTAGLNGLPFSWTVDGEIRGRENLTTEQNTALDVVIAAHDPTVQLAPWYPPLLIYRSLRTLSEQGAHDFLSQANKLDSAEFLAAGSARLDEPYIVEMLSLTGITVEALEAEIQRRLASQ